MRTPEPRHRGSVEDPNSPPPPSLPAAPPEASRPSHLGFVAHEIRNPMSTALWTAELLGRMSPAERAGDRGDKLTSLCFRSLTKVRLLVEDHLLCERLDAGGYPVRPERLPLTEVVEAVAKKLVGDTPPLERNIPPGLAVHADRSLLERALDGVIGAAGREATAVRVEAAADGDRVLVHVYGGPIGSLEDPHKGSPSDQRGRALALAMARRAAAAFGGDLAADGAGYRLSIPAA